jgi:hypothetical protein
MTKSGKGKHHCEKVSVRPGLRGCPRYRAVQPKDDKSAVLALAGYSIDNADQLLTDIREQVLPREAELVEQTEYGPKYRIRCTLKGPNGAKNKRWSIWMTEDATNQTKFVTLVPDRL